MGVSYNRTVAWLTRNVEAAQRETSARPEDATPSSEAADVGAATGNPFGMSAQAWWDSYIVRDQAMTIPAFRRAVSLIASQLGQLKLNQLDVNGKPIVPAPFLRQPDPKQTTAAVMTKTVEDLCLWGNAYWWNPRWNEPSGWRFANSTRKHKSIERIPPEDVAKVTREGFTLYVYGRTGTPRPIEVPPEAVIMFDAPSGHWLRDGARTLQTAQLLEDAVRTYAKTPLPQAVIRNQGARKTQSQVSELLNMYEASRQARSTAYVGRDLDITSFGFDAQQIALTDARSINTLDVSRLTGVPPIYLAQGVPNTSHQYSNLTQQRLDLHQAMQPFATAIEQRLSFDDVTGGGSTVAFDFTPFLRVDPMYRAEWYATLIPLGVMTVEQAQAMEQLDPVPNAPTKADPSGGIEGPNRTGTTGA